MVKEIVFMIKVIIIRIYLVIFFYRMLGSLLKYKFVIEGFCFYNDCYGNWLIKRLLINEGE